MTNKLFVRNLSWSVTENQLFQLFNQTGNVISVKIPTRREDGKPRGFAFVEMSSDEEAEKAIQDFNGSLLDTREIAVSLQDESRANQSSPLSKSSKLFIKNIGYSTSEKSLQTLFESVGNVTSVRIPTDRDSGQNKGFAFVEMTSTEEAEKAIATLNHQLLDSEEILVNYQRNTERPTNRRDSYNRDNSNFRHNKSYY